MCGLNMWETVDSISGLWITIATTCTRTRTCVHTHTCMHTHTHKLGRRRCAAHTGHNSQDRKRHLLLLGLLLVFHHLLQLVVGRRVLHLQLLALYPEVPTQLFHLRSKSLIRATETRRAHLHTRPAPSQRGPLAP